MKKSSQTRHISILIFSLAMLLIIPGSQLAAQNAQKTVQHKANFELANKFTPDQLKKLTYDSSVKPNWLENSDKFWYSYKTSDGTNFHIVDPVRKTKSELFDRMKLASDLTRFTTRAFNGKDLDMNSLKFVDDNKSIMFKIEKAKVDTLRFKLELSTGTLTFVDTFHAEKPDTSKWKGFSPDSTVMVFAREHNLYLMNADDPDSNETQITFDGELHYSYQSDGSDTTRNERLSARAGWSKDSKRFYIQRSDRRKVGDLWVINSIANPRPTLKTYKYPMPGEKNVDQPEAWIYNMDGGNMVKINLDNWIDQSIGSFRWSKTADKLYFTRRSRDYHKMDMCVANPSTGEIDVLFEERINGQILTKRLGIIEEGKDYLWWSLRDGWGHYYLYDQNGNVKNQVTSGPFMINSLVAVDTTARIMYVSGNGKEETRDPYYQHIYKVNFDGSGMQLLTPENGEHRASFSPNRKFFVDNWSRIDKEPVSVLRDSKGSLVLELEKTDVTRLIEAGWIPPEIFKAKAGDGVTDIWGVMWKPFDFDPNRKYPIIAHVYPGPQTESVPKSFSAANRNISLSQLGFIVIALGNRGGSPQRPLWYHEFGHGNLRDYGLEDKKVVIEQLSMRHDFIDIDKVGIYGHSGGGFMSTAAMLVYPDFFKVAVSSSGNHDNNVYNMWWSERHHGVEQVTDDEGNISWDAKIPTNPELAKNLKGHLLLVHGDIDNNVHPANTIRLVNELIKANKRFDFMIMPGSRHGFGSKNKYFVRMLWNYFAEHLLGDYRTNIDIFEDDKYNKR